MSSEPTKVDATAPTTAVLEDTDSESTGLDRGGDVGPKAKPALKDRIADLQLTQRASAVGGRLADRMKAAPSASDLAGRMKAAAGAVRLDKFNRDTLKAGRDGLAAKVEALLKPRAVEDGGPPKPSPAAESTAAPSAPPRAPEEPKTQGRTDVQALKARVDEALKATTQHQATDESAGRTSSSKRPTPPTAASQSVGDASPSPEIAGPVPTVTETQLPVLGYDITTRVKTGFSRLVSRRPGTPGIATQNEATLASPPDVANQPELAAPSIDEHIATHRTTTSRTTTSRTSRTQVARAEARRPIFSLGLIATAITAGGVLHILTTFAIPALNTGSAFDRLKWQLEPNTMRVMPVDANGQTPLPFLTADMRYAMCRYDITQSSVQVAALLPDIGWSLALYTPQGDNFYAVPGQDGRVVSAAFTINTASDRLLLPVPGVRRSDTDAAQVTSPQREGLVVIRAPNKGPAYLPSVELALKGATCRVVSRR